MSKQIRETLRAIIANITASQKLAKLVPGKPVDEIDRNLMLESLNEALAHATSFLDGYLVTCRGLEVSGNPLDEGEEVVYDNLAYHLVNSQTGLSGKEFAQLTEDQRFSAARVISREGVRFRTCGLGSDNVLFLQFPHIVIGIEPDGYAHS